MLGAAEANATGTKGIRQLGLIRLVDHRVLELVVAELATTPEITLSLNISPDTTMDADWWAGIESLMLAHPGVAQRLIVEITETVAIQDIDEVRGFATRLKNFGSKIAIDDFGAGYTSFRNLRNLGVDIVKIDGAFVQHITRSEDDRAFVQTFLDLARRLRLETVAEWVQDEESASLLASWGCDYIQGRLTGLASQERPWSPGEAAAPDAAAVQEELQRYSGDPAIVYVAVTDAPLADRLKAAACAVFGGFNAVGYARMDFRMNAAGELFFLEVNFACSVFYADGYEGSADYIVKHDGIGQRGFLLRIIAEGIARHARRQTCYEMRGSAISGYGIYAVRAIAAGETPCPGSRGPRME